MPISIIVGMLMVIAIMTTVVIGIIISLIMPAGDHDVVAGSLTPLPISD